MASIDGLASGLDTTSLIQQLMQIERQPQNRLKLARQNNDAAIDALKALNTKFLAIKNNAESLTEPTGWQPAKATSSNEAAALVTASAGAEPASLTFTVDHLATAGSAISAGSVGTLGDIVATPGATIDVTKGTDTRTVDVGDGSLTSVMKAINDEKMGVTATAVQVAPGEYRLQLSSTTTGAGTAVSIAAGSFAGPLGDMQELAQARDAKLTVGGTNPYEITRPSNTMSDLLDGVTITLQGEGATTVGVATDTEAMTASVKKLVDGVNSALADIKSKTAYNTTTNSGAVLTGDGMLRGLQGRLLGVFSAGTTVDGNTYSAGQFGITVERDGTIKLDEAKLATAFEEDPQLVQSVLGGEDGLAGRLETLAATATAPSRSTSDVGLITGGIQSRERQRTQMDNNIKGWDSRLELREQALIRQFTALEKALGQAQSQGQWLTSQLAGLQANMNV